MPQSEDELMAYIILRKLKGKGLVRMRDFINKVARETGRPRGYVYQTVWILRRAGAIKEHKKGRTIYISL